MAHWVAIGQAVEHILEIGVGFIIVEFCHRDQRCGNSPSVGAAAGASEQVVLAAQSDRADGSFHGIGVQFDTTIIKEAADPASMSGPSRRNCRSRLWRGRGISPVTWGVTKGVTKGVT